MSAEEAIAVRNKLGFTVDALAAELGLTPHVVQGWEAGQVRIPSKIAKELQWRSAVFDRQKALEESGLPECEWVVTWHEEPVPPGMKARTAHLERAIEHQSSCRTCRAREQFALERFGELPRRPMVWWMEGFAWIASRVDKWPEWTRPAVWVGLAFGGYSVLRIVVVLPSIGSNPSLVLTALGGLLLSVSIGAGIGLAYGALRALKSRWRAPNGRGGR